MIDLVLDAQGEDVVSGRRTPDTEETIARSLPAIAAELGDILKRLEREFGDVQDVEFTIEDGKLWILQTRSAKRTPRAALRIAIDLVREGLITQAGGAAADRRHRSGRAGRDLAGRGRQAGRSPASAHRAASRSDAPRSVPKAPSGLRPRAIR